MKNNILCKGKFCGGIGSIEFELQLRDDGEKAFSASGETSDSWGQCVEPIGKSVPAGHPCARIAEIHERWHLNDLRAGCAHQVGPEWEGKMILIGDRWEHSCHTWHSSVTKAYATKKSPEGLLLKPCPTCGYLWGSKWNTEKIPDDVEREVRELAALSATDAGKWTVSDEEKVKMCEAVRRSDWFDHLKGAWRLKASEVWGQLVSFNGKEEAQEILDELVHEMKSREASSQNNQRRDDSLDDETHDAAEKKASCINNQGPEFQIDYLRRLGVDLSKHMVSKK